MDYVKHWSLIAHAAMRGLTTSQKGNAGAYKRSSNPSNSKLVTIKYLFEREREGERERNTNLLSSNIRDTKILTIFSLFSRCYVTML